ncbi:linear amide C-N hydrolase, partial [Lactimicrobium sp.]
QFFHILGSVEQQRGCCDLGDGKYEITIYSSCCNMEKGIYYYRTYDNSQISAVNMHHKNLDGNTLASYPLVTKQQINNIN